MSDLRRAQTSEGACFRLEQLIVIERELKMKPDWSTRSKRQALTKYYVMAAQLMNMDMALYPLEVRQVVEQLLERSTTWRAAA